MGYRLQAMSFLVGTPESTAAAMSFCVHCLAAHPAAQAVLLRARRPTSDAPK
jgi:cytochrome P450